MQDIAERATVNRVTFYARFQDKYALLEYTVREMVRQSLHSQVPEGSPYPGEYHCAERPLPTSRKCSMIVILKSMKWSIHSNRPIC